MKQFTGTYTQVRTTTEKITISPYYKSNGIVVYRSILCLRTEHR